MKSLFLGLLISPVAAGAEAEPVRPHFVFSSIDAKDLSKFFWAVEREAGTGSTFALVPPAVAPEGRE